MRHFVLFFGFMILFLSSKKGNFKISKIIFIPLILLILLSIAMLTNENTRWLNYSIGLFFTLLFLIINFFSWFIKIEEVVVIRLIKNIVRILLIMGLIPFTQALASFQSMRWYPGLFRELGALGGAMNIGVVLSLFLLVYTNKKKYFRLAVVFSIIIFATILKKSIIDLFLIWILFFWLFSKEYNLIKLRRVIFLSISVVIPFIIPELLDNITQNANYLNNVGAEGHVRLVMYLVSFSIAINFFPLGSGFGSFGSPASVFNTYSSIYHDYGISTIDTMSPYKVMNGFHHTLYDTYWPHILGELGFIGFILFLLIWLYPIIQARLLHIRYKSLNSKLIYFTTLAIITFISLDGFTLFNPEIPFFIFFSHGLIGIIYNSLNKIA